jgi:hypothetical protein
VDNFCPLKESESRLFRVRLGFHRLGRYNHLHCEFRLVRLAPVLLLHERLVTKFLFGQPVKLI